MPPKGPVYYAVRVGRVPGVYTSWGEAELQVKGFQGAVHKKFSTKIEADSYVSLSQTSGPYNGAINFIQRVGGASNQSSATSHVKNADLSSQGSTQQTDAPKPPKCACGIETVKLVVSKENQNKGREFYHCKNRACNFFKWASEPRTELSEAGGASNAGNSKEYDVVIYSDGGCLGNQDVVNNNHPAGW